MKFVEILLNEIKIQKKNNTGNKYASYNFTILYKILINDKIKLTYFVTQCAAVKTAPLLIIDAPHRYRYLPSGCFAKRDTIHGNSAK